jgi:hypothetical protein
LCGEVLGGIDHGHSWVAAGVTSCVDGVACGASLCDFVLGLVRKGCDQGSVCLTVLDGRSGQSSCCCGVVPVENCKV